MEPYDRIRRRVKLHDLHILMTVVQARSMNKAAALLNSTQPAISRAIGELERTIGVPLLDRSPRGVEPTDYGRALLEGGIAVFDDLHHAMQKIEFLDDPTAGIIRLGCSPLLAATFVPSVIVRVARHAPRIEFQLVSAPVETVHRDLLERNLDLLITRKQVAFAERLSFEHLFDDSFVVVAGKQHPLARQRRLALSQLASQSWVSPPPDTVLGSSIVEGFRAAGLGYPRAAVTTISPEARISLVKTGRYVTIFPASALSYSSKQPDIVILPVALPMAPVPIGIVTLKNRTLSPAVRLFVERAREVAKPLARRKS
jgi:DNA-binding transcriptional LysR family regulator